MIPGIRIFMCHASRRPKPAGTSRKIEASRDNRCEAGLTERPGPKRGNCELCFPGYVSRSSFVIPGSSFRLSDGDRIVKIFGP